MCYNLQDTYWNCCCRGSIYAREVLEGEKVINNPNRTRYTAYGEEIIMPGKTGTAELKFQKKYFQYRIRMACCFTSEETVEAQY